MSVARETFMQELAEKTFASVPFGMSRRELEDAAAAFFRFLALPQEEKERLHFYDRPENRQGIGYVRKSGAEDEAGKQDYKEFFHYHPKIEKEFANSPLVKREETAAFLATGKRVYAEALKGMKQVIEALEPESPGLWEQLFPETEEHIEYSALRFLKYEPSGEGNFLARAHYDRGCLTLAIAESAPGLRIGKNEASLKEVEHKEGAALFMPAYQLYSMTGNKVLPAWHDVVQSSDDVYAENAARWAIVLFADAPGAPVPTKIEAHTPVV